MNIQFQFYLFILSGFWGFGASPLQTSLPTPQYTTLPRAKVLHEQTAHTRTHTHPPAQRNNKTKVMCKSLRTCGECTLNKCQWNDVHHTNTASAPTLSSPPLPAPPPPLPPPPPTPARQHLYPTRVPTSNTPTSTQLVGCTNMCNQGVCRNAQVSESTPIPS